MNKKIQKFKKTIATHAPTAIVAATVGATAVFTYYNRKTLLEVPAWAADRLKEEGGAMIYQTSHGDFMLRYCPSA